MATVVRKGEKFSRVFKYFQRYATLQTHKIEHYHKHGWVAVDNFFNEEETAALCGALTDLASNGTLANVSTDGDGKTYSEKPRSLQTCPLSPHKDIFKMLPFHPKVSEAIHELLCDSNPKESACCYLSQTFWKPPQEGLGTSWHQDNAYFLVKNAHKGCGMWIPVHDSYIENGTLELCDTRSEILEHKRDKKSDHHITCNESLDDSGRTSVEIKAGGAIFFDYNTPHRTSSNVTNKARAAIAYHYLNMNDFIFRQFPLPEDAEYVTPVMCGPNNTLGEKEYGYKVWNQEKFQEEVEKNKKFAIAEVDVSFKFVKQDK